MNFPFEAGAADLEANLDSYVDAIFGCLESEFLVMPKGKGFVEFETFDTAYEALKRATRNFTEVRPDTVEPVVFRQPVSLIVLRCMLGFTPPEWAYYASEQTDTEVTQGAARAIDRRIRMSPQKALTGVKDVTKMRVRALVSAACHALGSGAPEGLSTTLHRLDQADTRDGLTSVQSLAGLGAPYSVLLYERLLGRPFAAHRDSVSELVGDIVENAIEDVLTRAGITYRKTKRMEKVPGFDQAPDFFVPNEFNPSVVIEAKLTEDDGTARDKVTRVQHLEALSVQRQGHGKPSFEVVACIAGRGFKVRREDMKKLIRATRGKVFTLQDMKHLVGNTRMAQFRTL